MTWRNAWQALFLGTAGAGVFALSSISACSYFLQVSNFHELGHKLNTMAGRLDFIQSMRAKRQTSSEQDEQKFMELFSTSNETDEKDKRQNK